MKLAIVRKVSTHTLKNKLILSFSVTILILSTFMLISNFIWYSALSKKTHESTYKDVTNIAQNTSQKIKSIEYLSYRIIDDSIIQEKLMDVFHNTSGNTLILQKQYLTNYVNNLTRDTSDVHNSFLIDTSGSNLTNFISSYEHIIEGVSIKKILKQLPNHPSQGKWYFNASMSQAIFARKIFATQNLSLRYLGTIVFVIDTSFFTENMRNASFYSTQDLFFLQYQKNFYSPVLTKKIVLNYKRQYLKNAQTFSKSATINFQNIDYYTSTYTVGDFTFHYLVPDKHILSDLNKIQETLIVIMLLLLIGILVLILKFSAQLTDPITQLAKHMRQIQNTKDISSLQPITYPKSDQNELSILYKSYNQMTMEIKQLVKDNYEIKILSQEIEFKSLQAQLDPHFLYNTLDSINWLALANNQPEIAKMVTSLAYLFRKKIDTSSDFSTLTEEIELIKAYIVIQQVRFDSRFIFLTAIEIDDCSIQIPKLLIQPLIENVFKFAVSNMKKQCIIKLSIWNTKNFLCISVSDNGPGFSSNFNLKNSSGIGLKNISERLNLYYGKQANVKITESEAFKMTTVQIQIPKNKLEETQ